MNHCRIILFPLVYKALWHDLTWFTEYSSLLAQAHGALRGSTPGHSGIWGMAGTWRSWSSKWKPFGHRFFGFWDMFLMLLGYFLGFLGDVVVFEEYVGKCWEMLKDCSGFGKILVYFGRFWYMLEYVGVFWNMLEDFREIKVESKRKRLSRLTVTGKPCNILSVGIRVLVSEQMSFFQLVCIWYEPCRSDLGISKLFFGLWSDHEQWLKQQRSLNFANGWWE